MRYFTIAELIKSETADKKAIDNRLPKELLPNAQALVDNVLDPLREAYGKPITVTSGYRCPALNKAVGGSKTSDHCFDEETELHFVHFFLSLFVHPFHLELGLHTFSRGSSYCRTHYVPTYRENDART